MSRKVHSTAATGALRQRLQSALKSSGGRPKLQGTHRRQKIPLSDEDWKSLRAIARSLSAEDLSLAPGQVASQLLHDAIQAYRKGALPAPSAETRARRQPFVVADVRGPAYRPGGSAPGRHTVLSLLKAHAGEIHGLGVEALSLFGSVARDEAGPESDVDLMVEFREPVTSDKFFDTKFFLEDLLRRRVDLVTRAALGERLHHAIEPELIRVA